STKGARDILFYTTERDDRGRVVRCQQRPAPGFMDVFAVELVKLGNPGADKVTVGIETLALPYRAEHPEVRRGISTGRRTPLPAAVIGGKVTINEVLHEEAFAPAPVDKQVLGQEHGDHHAQPVMHPAGSAQLAH